RTGLGQAGGGLRGADSGSQRLISRSSRNTSGWRNAISISACAGPEGLRRPCSHSCRVRGEMCSTSANSRCVRPVLLLACATSLGCTWQILATFAAFISFTDWRSLLPMSSPVSVSLLIFQHLTNRLQDMCGYVLHDGLFVDHQQPDHATWQSGEVNYSYSTPLPCARNRPANLSTSTATRNDITCLRIGCQPGKECAPLFVGPNIPGICCKCGSFDDRVQGAIVRHWRGCAKD